MTLQRGRITTIYLRDGYGFIDDIGGAGVRERFFHSRFITGGGTIDDFEPGDIVEYEPTDSQKGPRALKVRRVEE